MSPPCCSRTASKGRTATACSCAASTTRNSGARSVPGDRLRLEVTLGQRRGRIVRAAAVAYVDDEPRGRGRARDGPRRGRDRRGACVRSSTPPPSSIRARASAPARAIGPHVGHRRARHDRPQLPHRRLDGHRRLHRDRRRERDLPDDVDRPDPAGPQVRRRTDAAGHRPPQRDPRVRHHPSRHRRRRRAHADRRPQPVHGLHPHRARLPRGERHHLRERRDARRPRDVDDYATVGAFSGVHQFCRVGRYAFIGGYSVVTKDAMPLCEDGRQPRALLRPQHDRPRAPRSSRPTRSRSCAAPTASCCTPTRAAPSRRSRRTRRCSVRKCVTSWSSSGRRTAASG